MVSVLVGGRENIWRETYGSLNKGADGGHTREGHDKWGRRRTLTFVIVSGAQVVGLGMLEGQQGAREGKREDGEVAAHGLLSVASGAAW